MPQVLQKRHSGCESHFDFYYIFLETENGKENDADRDTKGDRYTDDFVLRRCFEGLSLRSLGQPWRKSKGLLNVDS